MGKPNVRSVNLDSALTPIAGTASDIVISSAAVLLQGSKELPDNTTHVFLGVKDGSVYVTYDGSTPSSTNGFLWPVGTAATVGKDQYLVMKMIRATGTDARVHACPVQE